MFNFTGCSRNYKKLCSNAPVEHFARYSGTVKWHPYNVEAIVFSFVKQFGMEFFIFNVNVNIKKRSTRIAIIFLNQFQFCWINIFTVFLEDAVIT